MSSPVCTPSTRCSTTDDPGARLPIWVADYVLASYGTGAIMSVPGHDERDHEFARKFDLPVREVVRPPQDQAGLSEGVCFTGDGTAVHSGPIDGLASPEAKKRVIELLEEAAAGQRGGDLPLARLALLAPALLG